MNASFSVVYKDVHLIIGTYVCRDGSIDLKGGAQSDLTIQDTRKSRFSIEMSKRIFNK